MKKISGSRAGFVVLLAALLVPPVCGQGPRPLREDDQVAAMDIREHLGESIPLDLVFTDSDGSRIRLTDCFKGDKPVLMALAYYECPTLCTLGLNGLSDGGSDMTWTPGDEFNMVTVSIDPRETATLAAGKRTNYVEALGKEIKPEGWRFLVGDKEEIEKLARAIGFGYFYDVKQDMYAHPAAVYILTPDGKISRYLYGVKFEEKDLRLCLLEAADGKIGSIMNRFILYCYQFDPEANRYVLFAQNVMRLGGAITLVAILVFLGGFWIWEWRRRKSRTV